MNLFFLILLIHSCYSLSYLLTTTTPSILVYATDANEKNKDVVCIGDYYFKANEFGEPDINFPPSKIPCSIINGTLSFTKYNPSYAKYIPSSIRSIKVVNGALGIRDSKQFPPLNKLNEVGNLYMMENKFESSWAISSLTIVNNKIHIESSQNINLSFPNLIKLGELYVHISTISKLAMLKLNDCGSITIESTELQSLSGLKNVNNVKGNLIIKNAVMSSLEMDSLTSIEGSFLLQWCRLKLLNIDFANGIDIGGNLSIESNIGGINFKTLKGSTNIHGSVYVTGNAIYETINLSGLNPVFIGESIVIETNSIQIIMFDVSNISMIYGDVIITYLNDKSEYPFFMSLKSISGNVYIPSTIKQNDTIIPQFPKLKQVNGTLIAKNVNGITDLRLLREFDYVGSLSVDSCLGLTSLKGLEHFTSLVSLSIISCENLKSLKELRNLVNIDDYLWIVSNSKIISLEGLQNVKHVGSLQIHNNENLASINVFNHLQEIKGEVALYYNYKLTSLKGLDNLKRVGSLIIYGTWLKSLKGMNKLIEVNGELAISHNKRLRIIDGFKSLIKVKKLNLDFYGQYYVKVLRIGKKGSNLGYPWAEIHYDFSLMYLTLKDLKRFLTPFCKDEIKPEYEGIYCNH